MSWPFDTSEPLVTPEQAAEALRLHLRITPEAWRLPPTLILTFQRAAHQHALKCVGVAPDSPEAIGTPLRADPVVGETHGLPVSVARSGIGAPAAAVVLEQAIARGARNVLVVGGAGSLQPDLPTGSIVVVVSAEREDGTSHHYLPAGERVTADEDLSALLERCLIARGANPTRGRAWTIDAPYRETVGAIQHHRETGVAVVEMEAAAIFAVARVRGVRSALVVAVSDELSGKEWNNQLHGPTFGEALRLAVDAVVDAAGQL